MRATAARRNKIGRMSWAEAEDMSDRATSRTDVLRASPPMFDSRLLDALSRVHPAVPVVIFLPAIVALDGVGAVERERAGDGRRSCVGGYALWTLFEYWLHRIVFHFEPEDGLGARLHWIIHGVHHDHPNDPHAPGDAAGGERAAGGGRVRAAVPDLRPALRARRSARASSPATWSYDMIHYYLHHFRPRGRLGRMLRERHMRHHFQDDTRGFGISAPYWDEVFRTSRAREAILAMSGIEPAPARA